MGGAWLLGLRVDSLLAFRIVSGRHLCSCFRGGFIFVRSVLVGCLWPGWTGWCMSSDGVCFVFLAVASELASRLVSMIRAGFPI